MSARRVCQNPRFEKDMKTKKCIELPSELLTIIFGHLNRNGRNTKDIQQCALTCRSWRSIIRPLIFSSITIRKKRNFDALDRLVTKDNIIGKLVKTLNIATVVVDFQRLDLVDSLFPQLEVISIPKTDLAFKALYDILTAGKLSNLTQIPVPRTNYYQSELYVKCVEIQRHRLSDIRLVSGNTYEPLCKKLGAFTNLKNVHITYNHAPVSIMDIVQTITQNKKLKTVKQISFNMTGHSRSYNLSTQLNDIEPMINLSHLKIFSFDLHSFDINDAFMLYVMTKFPNLKKLITRRPYDYYKDDPSMIAKNIKISADVVTKFLSYLLKIDTCFVDTIITEDKTATIIRNTLGNIKKDSYNLPCLMIRYDRHTSNAAVENSLRYPILAVDTEMALFNDRCIIITFDPKLNGGGRLERDLIEQSGQFFTKIILSETPASMCGPLLKNIARHCTSLKQLNLKEIPLLLETFEYENLTTNQVLSRLELGYCKISTNLMSLISNLFPSLNTLDIIDFALKPTFVMIDIADFSVDHLRIGMILYYEPKPKDYSVYKLLLVLEIGGNPRYFHLAFQALKEALYPFYPLQFVKELAQFEFENMQHDQHCFLFHIRCRSLKKISLRYNTYCNMVGLLDTSNGDFFELHL